MITAPPPVKETKNYLNAEVGLKSWLLTKDHKRIAVLYLIVVTAFFALPITTTFLLLMIYMFLLLR